MEDKVCFGFSSGTGNQDSYRVIHGPVDQWLLLVVAKKSFSQRVWITQRSKRSHGKDMLNIFVIFFFGTNTHSLLCSGSWTSDAMTPVTILQRPIVVGVVVFPCGGFDDYYNNTCLQRGQNQLELKRQSLQWWSPDHDSADCFESLLLPLQEWSPVVGMPVIEDYDLLLLISIIIDLFSQRPPCNNVIKEKREISWKNILNFVVQKKLRAFIALPLLDSGS